VPSNGTNATQAVTTETIQAVTEETIVTTGKSTRNKN